MRISQWVSAKEASQKLGISEMTLSVWREVGYLKQGTHWRSSLEFLPAITRFFKLFLVTDFFYHVQWCKEEMDYWRSHDARIVQELH